LPRELELPDDGVLRIRPLRELTKLRYAEKLRAGVHVKDGGKDKVPEASGDAVELEITVAGSLPREFSLSLLGDDAETGGMRIVAGTGRKTLRVGDCEAPFELAPNEDLKLRIFIDKNLVEVFANDRQAIVWAVKTPHGEPNVSLAARGGDAIVRSIKAWRLRSIYAPE
jgi:beta-fructofuranosidase